jgi:putative CocE/NonD family hydrolase
MYRPPRDRRPFIVGGAVVALVLALAVTYFVTRGGGSGSTQHGIASDVSKTIPVDGASLSAEVVTPDHDSGAPLLVIPGAWGAKARTYKSIATEFAQSGYQVVVYAQRGLGGSTGEADFAGLATQRDASAVIDWALQHTHADQHKIGMFGISYGAGISLLAAARDPRIKAVAALSTWADVAESYDQNGTPNIGGLGSLIGGDPANQGRHYDSTVQQLRHTLLNSPAHLGSLLHKISPVRSPDHYVDKLNKNGPAIMIANAYQDSLLNPRQLLPFFAQLSTPKKLELAAGDHGGPELSALTGNTANQTLIDARAWLDHYIRGTNNGVQTEDPIVLRNALTGQVTTYRKWPSPTSKDRVTLAPPGKTLNLGDTPNPTWTGTIQHAGADSGASSGPLQIFNPTYRAPSVMLSAVKATDALVWNGPTLSSDVPIVGVPSIRLGLSSTSKTATIYVHFYDVAQNGLATLVDFEPYTATGLSKDKTTYVTIDMQPISWTVSGGHRLTLVVDTFDKRYQSLTPAGNSVTVSSTRTAPDSFTAPVAR